MTIVETDEGAWAHTVCPRDLATRNEPCMATITEITFGPNGEISLAESSSDELMQKRDHDEICVSGFDKEKLDG